MQRWQEVLSWAADTAAEKGGAAAPAAGAAGAPAPPNILSMIIPVLFIFILYQLIISGPKQKAEAKKREAALNTLGKGDKVVTTAGIHGTVESVEKEKGIVNVTIQAAPKVVVQFSRGAISSYTKRGEEDEAKA